MIWKCAVKTAQESSTTWVFIELSGWWGELGGWDHVVYVNKSCSWLFSYTPTYYNRQQHEKFLSHPAWTRIIFPCRDVLNFKLCARLPLHSIIRPTIMPLKVVKMERNRAEKQKPGLTFHKNFKIKWSLSLKLTYFSVENKISPRVCLTRCASLKSWRKKGSADCISIPVFFVLACLMFVSSWIVAL